MHCPTAYSQRICARASGKVGGGACNALDGLPLVLGQQVAHLRQTSLLVGALELAQSLPAEQYMVLSGSNAAHWLELQSLNTVHSFKAPIAYLCVPIVWLCRIVLSFRKQERCQPVFNIPHPWSPNLNASLTSVHSNPIIHPLLPCNNRLNLTGHPKAPTAGIGRELWHRCLGQAAVNKFHLTVDLMGAGWLDACVRAISTSGSQGGTS